MRDATAHLSPVWTHYTSIIAARGEGALLFDEEGKTWLDFTCGIAVTNTGHCHPRVVAAIQRQAALLLHGQANIVYHRPMLELVQELLPLTAPLDGFFFSNSGAEAVEGAIKLARKATGRPNIIVFQGSFHGRTAAAMALTTSKTIYRAGYQPLPAGVFVAPYPYAYRYGWDPEQTSAWCLEEFDFLLTTQTAPDETAAVLVEPVLGEGGYVVPPASFLQGLRRRCDEHGILFIADEIQTGFGRTGRWFGYEHFGVQPDIITIAKGLGSGLPISGVVASLDLMRRWPPGSHGGTYGGNAVAAAAAVATIRVIREEGLLENARARGQQLMTGLRHLQEAYPAMGDVRGLGLMIGVEFRTPDRRPDKATAKAVAHACLERGLLLLTCGPWDNTIRWIPPLVVTEAQIEEALNIFEQALAAVLG
ncbi:MAG: aminotransferase class III-fold pyridoxal phosphate-dependent enzyme [Caldilineales bacterium]|nr:aminotransferase class III-fold pyridoxal phosphate-dependent enzyme [Caldilineales bacterium]MCX7851972.1 aminotransferase class III-fold pyridoxal phosphate-dependent enzyme [Caldilineales bacterium]